MTGHPELPRIPALAPRKLRHDLWIAIGLPLLLLLRLGQDGNWDLRNYHLYNAHAWWHGRYSIDIAPTQLQSWHNPLLDLPLAWLQAAAAPGWLVSLWLTVPMMLATGSLLRLPDRLGVALPTAGRWALALAALTGAAAFSALGSSFDDGFVAAGMLTALLLLLPGGHPPGQRRVFLAGLLGGATAGLKLTAATYCLGLAAALICTSPRPRRLTGLLVLLAGGCLGALATYGYWGAFLWRAHGNPVFPYINTIFGSPDAPGWAIADLRFRAATWSDALAIPFRLVADTQRYSEPTMRDPRLLVGVLAAALWRWGPVPPDATAARISFRAVIAFSLVSFLVWARQYGIYRYALPLEMLASALAITWLARTGPRWQAPAMMLTALLLVATTNHPNWGRSRFRTPWVSVRLPPLPHDLLVTTGSMLPVAYVATALPDDVPIVAFYNNFMAPDHCTRLQAAVERRLREHAGPIWLLRGDDPSADLGQQLAASQYGLLTTGECLPVATSLGDLRLCPLRRVPRPPVCPAATAADR